MGGGNDTINVGLASGLLNHIDGLVQIDGQAGEDHLALFDGSDTVANVGLLQSQRILGLGMGSTDQSDVTESGGIGFTQIEGIDLQLGLAADTIRASAIEVNTTVHGGAGDDHFVLQGSLKDVKQQYTLIGDAGQNQLSVNMADNVQSNLTLSALNASKGVLKDAGMLGQVQFQQVDGLDINLGQKDDTVNIDATVAPVVLNLNVGKDSVVVHDSAHALDIRLGGGADNDQVTVIDAHADIQVSGNGGTGFKKLTVDKTAAVTALNGAVLDNLDGQGATLTDGKVTGLTTGQIAFEGVQQVNVLLGAGNDALRVNQSLTETELNIDGGQGNDTVRVEKLGSANTSVKGGANADVLTLIVDGVPKADQFTSLTMDVDQLVVDNQSNTTTGVSWTHQDGAKLLADIQGGPIGLEVVNTDGAGYTVIQAGTQSDQLTVKSTSSGNVAGSVEGNQIELRAGAVVLKQSG